jgi:N-acetyl-gamma-glutamyl-phosphate reductase
MSSLKAVRVAVLGARGYSGRELVRLLNHHPWVELEILFSQGGKESQLDPATLLSEPLQARTTVEGLQELPAKLRERGVTWVFLATPAEVSMEWAPKILQSGVSVIDLSGAYRLAAEQYPSWYGFEHQDPQGLQVATFGLQPLVSRFQQAKHEKKTEGPKLVSNPGCYATSVILSLVPLMSSRARELGVQLRPDSVVIDAKSGTSGAGRHARENLLFTEVYGECRPYRIGRHQHEPEIQWAVEKFSGSRFRDFHFGTTLLPVKRGILSSIYATLEAPTTVEALSSLFQSFYGDYPLLEHAWAQSPRGQQLLNFSWIVGSSRIHLVYHVEGRKLFLHSLLDNLLKGAASQAVENLNSAMGWPLDFGLKQTYGSVL